jgi:hypothetical protein
MGGFLPYLLVAGCLAAVMGGLARLASVARRRGMAGSAMRAALASHDEAFRVTAHDSHYEIQAQAERKAPIHSPDDPWRPSHDEAARPGAEGRPLRPRPRRLRRYLHRVLSGRPHHRETL